MRTQGPQKPFARIHGVGAFQMKPDIALMKAGKAHFILDAKWKEIDGGGNDPKHGISQGDIYQLYAYGRKYGCPKVALIYPKTQRFNSPLKYQFKDKMPSQPLTLICFPFDVEHPQSSVEEILQQLTN